MQSTLSIGCGRARGTFASVVASRDENARDRQDSHVLVMERRDQSDLVEKELHHLVKVGRVGVGAEDLHSDTLAKLRVEENGIFISGGGSDFEYSPISAPCNSR